ncbi:hypothetical protein [Nioella nitratireducens]|uniref:hypothetical protein n=1 Tax=Nioella nitratireducens TaxID=1287720 RepID=UPI0011BADEC0|nr:hypothetical protein [Nioella nitratireducens]
MTKNSKVTMPNPAMQSGAPSSSVPIFVTEDIADCVRQALCESGAQVNMIPDGGLDEGLTAGEGLVGLVWDTPATAVAEALFAGRDPVPAVSDWLDRHSSLLSHVRRHRRRIRLCDGRLFSPPASAEDLARVGAWLGLARIPDPQYSDIPDGLALARLLVSHTIPRLDSLRDCLDELEASSLTTSDTLLPLPALGRSVQGFDCLKHLTEDLRAGRERAELHEQEINLLREQLGLQLQEAQRVIAEQAERESTEIATLKGRLADTTRAAEDAKETLRNQEEARRLEAERKEQEITLLREQLGLLLEEMSRLTETQTKEATEIEKRRTLIESESQRALARALTDLRSEARQRKSLQDRLDEMQAQFAALEEERNGLALTVEELYASRSWRITRPLRQVRTLVSPIAVPGQNEQSGS